MMRTLIIGAGPAGLTAALELAKNGQQVTVLEMDHTYVGGISKTIDYKGYKFDIGGHRFYTKDQEIESLWKEWLGKDLLLRKRKSRILYEGKYYDYPISLWNALRNLGIVRAFSALVSYFKFRLFPIRQENSYADWMTNRFGKVLFNTFFKTYTEKVWGIPVNQISKDWAIQRVKTFSLLGAVLSAIIPGYGKRFKTLVDEFLYPRLGPGMMWEECAHLCKSLCVEIHMGTAVVGLIQHNSEWHAEVLNLKTTQIEKYGPFENVISTMPLNKLVPMIAPTEAPVMEHAKKLRYRDFVTVLLVIKKRDLFPDNWIYIHDPAVLVGRVQNFKNWSPEMVPDPETTSLGFEYFIFENDALWSASDEKFLEMAKKEAVYLGFCGDISEITDGKVVRVPKAYPAYETGYDQHVAEIAAFLDTVQGLYTIGRNGMHRWNNQDHSMKAGLVAARQIISGNRSSDIWNINIEEEYQEETRAIKDRAVPQRIVS